MSISILLVQDTLAQDADLSVYGCGTLTPKEEINKIYRHAPDLINMKRTAVADTLPLSIHLVGNDNGTGHLNTDQLLRMLCRINERYSGTGISFYIMWPIHFINNSTYYKHTASVGLQMMREYNIPNSINVYFVNDPDGTCGYYHPSGGAVAIKNQCAGINSTTLTHELGHFLGLPHTFYGWEDGDTPTNPEKVTRGPGANCSTAGDGFCDTDADYLANRWNCPYRGNKIDINGDLYHPDSSLYMSYAADICMSRFSNMQIAWMQNTIEAYPELTAAASPSYSDFSSPTVLYPTDSIHANLMYLIWNSVDNAEVYHVRVTQKGTGTLLTESITADTILPLNHNMVQNNSYNIRIAPMNGINVCRSNSFSKDFIYTNAPTDLTLLSFSDIPPGVRIFPNPVAQTLNISLDFMPEGNYRISLRNITGQLVHQYNFNHTKVNSTIHIDVSSFANGLYFIYLIGGNKTTSQKLFITH